MYVQMHFRSNQYIFFFILIYFFSKVVYHTEWSLKAKSELQWGGNSFKRCTTGPHFTPAANVSVHETRLVLLIKAPETCFKWIYVITNFLTLQFSSYCTELIANVDITKSLFILVI